MSSLSSVRSPSKKKKKNLCTIINITIPNYYYYWSLISYVLRNTISTPSYPRFKPFKNPSRLYIYVLLHISKNISFTSRYLSRLLEGKPFFLPVTWLHNRYVWYVCMYIHTYFVTTEKILRQISLYIIHTYIDPSVRTVIKITIININSYGVIPFSDWFTWNAVHLPFLA